MDYENVLGESKFPTYEQLKSGLIRLIEEGKITREDAGMILPQLRESEDERIRKEIVSALKFANVGGVYDKHIAYLEKQKEHSMSAEEVLAKAGLKPYKDGNQWCILAGDNIQEGICGFGDTIEDALYEFLKEILDLQKEQKPASISCSHENDTEWSEDYNEEDIQTRFAFYTYKDEPSTLYLSNVFVEEASRNHGFGTKILMAAERVAETIGATTIRLKVKQDSPANAWYRKNGYGYVTFEDGYDWLEKNLEYLKPAKSAEWSEEDEEMYARIVRRYTDYEGVIMRTKEESVANKMLDAMEQEEIWLKSLRPQSHWKPSEEQMRALIEIICLGEISYVGQEEELISLKNNLKKLM